MDGGQVYDLNLGLEVLVELGEDWVGLVGVVVWVRRGVGGLGWGWEGGLLEDVVFLEVFNFVGLVRSVQTDKCADFIVVT